MRYISLHSSWLLSRLSQRKYSQASMYQIFWDLYLHLLAPVEETRQ